MSHISEYPPTEQHWPSGKPTSSRNLCADRETERRYTEAGWWGTETLSDIVARHATSSSPASSLQDDSSLLALQDTYPKISATGAAFIEEDRYWDWQGYHLLAGRLAEFFADLDFERTERILVFLPDSGLLHAVYLAAERAGLIVVGVGRRAGKAELSHLIGRCEAVAFVELYEEEHRNGYLFESLRSEHPHLRHHIQIADVVNKNAEIRAPLVTELLVSIDGQPCENLQTYLSPDTNPDTDFEFPNRLGPSELFLLNSTSGTTGLPKCVMQTQNRWFYFHQLAETYGALTPEDRFCVAVPAPFGFGLWTTHFTPTILGIPTILMRRFSPELLLRLIERERATVLCAVTTQFIMMLNSPNLAQHDLTSLRVLFTGGEAIPPQRAQEFEQQTGAVLLNFYGSNETGVLTGTRIDDPQQVRLTTAGRPVPEMNVRLLHPETATVLKRWDFAEGNSKQDAWQDISQDISQGVPACKGPAMTLGYYDDDTANAELFTEDGWMLMGDIVRFKDDCLQVVGRASDFIIRGGKNISAPAVEAEVMTHPAVRLAAAVAAPDEVFGERVAVYVELREGASLDLEDLNEHLKSRGVSKEWFPEYLVVIDTIPRSSGAKMAKGELREDIISRLES